MKKTTKQIEFCMDLEDEIGAAIATGTEASLHYARGVLVSLELFCYIHQVEHEIPQATIVAWEAAFKKVGC